MPVDTLRIHSGIENIYIPNEWGYGNWEEKVLSETYIPLFTNASYTNEELTYELVGTSDWNSGIVSEGSESYYEYSSYYDLVPGSVEKVIAAVAATQKSDKKWLADATKYLEDAQKAQEDAQKAYDNSVKLEKPLRMPTLLLRLLRRLRMLPRRL